MVDLTYKPPPIIEKFLHDTSLVRVLVGPLGCVSGDTEFLSPHGWVRIDQWNGEQVAEWEPDTGKAVFRYPRRYVVEGCATMLWFRNKHGLSMQVSNEHQVPLYDNDGKLVVKDAIEVAYDKNNYTVPIFFTPERPGIDWDEPTLRLAVAINADGYYAGYQTQVQLRKARKIIRLRNLLIDCNIEYNEAVYGETTRFTFYSEYKGRRYDGEWWNASPAQLAVIIDEMSHWDGLAEHAETRFHTAYKSDADFIQYAAHACGRRATIRTINRLDKPNYKTEYTVNIAKQDGRRNRTMIHRESLALSRENTIDGKKYCFTTKSGYFVARHQNKIFNTGNSGKSMGCIMDLIKHAFEQTPHNNVRYTRGALIRNTLQQLRQTVLADIQSYLGPLLHFYVTDSTVQFRTALPDGTLLHSDWVMIPLDTKEDVRRLLSMQLTFAWINEIREIPVDVVSGVIGRLGRYPSRLMGGPTWYGLIADTNPWDTDSPYHERLVLNPQPNWKLFHQPSGLSPTAENVENLPPGYYQTLAGDHDEGWVSVHVESEWGTSNAGQAVFRKSFHAPTHVRELGAVINPYLPIMVGVDFGRTPCALIAQADNYGRLIIYEEVVTEGMGLLQMLQEHLKPKLLQQPYNEARMFIVADPAGNQKSQITEETAFDVLKHEGFLAYPASTNNIEPRLLAVERMFRSTIMGEPAVQISRAGCPTLIQALGNKYRYRRRRDGQFEDLPEKLHPWSDVCDCLQYLCLGVHSNYQARFMRRDRGYGMGTREKVSAAGWT